MKSIFSICLVAGTLNVASPPSLFAQEDVDLPGPGIVASPAPAGSRRSGELLAQMKRIASYMEQYSVQNNSFYDQEMIKAAIVQLNQLVPNNPYSHNYMTAPDDELTDQNEPMDNGGQNLTLQNRVSLIVDESLSDLQAEEYRSNPPDEWNGPPGAITVITNNRNMFIVFGDGLDGHPIKDPDTGRYAVLFGHYHLYLHGDI